MSEEQSSSIKNDSPEKIIVAKKPKEETKDPLFVVLGHAKNGQAKKITCTPDTLFGRHCAILGTTGSGKSWTLSHLIAETLRFDPKVIIFDASGEFCTLRDGVHHVAIGSGESPSEIAEEVGVPYYHLRETDLFAIFKPNGANQAPKLRAAINSLKLAKLSPLLAPNGSILKAHRSKIEFEKERRRHSSLLEDPEVNIDIRLLTTQIQNECVEPQASALDPNVWGGPNSLEYSSCVPLINRIHDMVNLKNLSCIFRPEGKQSIFETIDNFFNDPNGRVLRISLKYLPFEYGTREIIANAIGRHILELARAGQFLQKPLLLVVDEAHQFLGDTYKEKNEFSPSDSFGLIAKEGRKYSLVLCLATQRPRDVPEDVLSQIGTFLVHRVTNDYDLLIIERACGQVNRNTMNALPSLAPGEAFLFGVNIPNPIPVQIDVPEFPPDSRGPDFQKTWR